MQEYFSHPLLNVGITFFYCLIVMAMLQAAKWHYAAIILSLFLGVSLLMVALFSLPENIVGTGGGIALKQEAKDIFIVAMGAMLGVVVSVLIRFVKKLF